MAKKFEDVKMNYDTLWFKIFMDSVDITFYNKEIYLTEGFNSAIDYNQIVGNIGSFPRQNNFNKDVDILIISDVWMLQLKAGEAPQFIADLEVLLNTSSSPYRKLKFTTEKLFVEYLKMRANGNIKINKTDIGNIDNSSELKIQIQQAIDEDERLLEMLNVSRKKRQEPIQQSLF